MAKKKVDLSKVKAAMFDLFSCLTPEEQSVLEREILTQTLKKNEIICRECDSIDHIFCLLSGKVKIYKNGIGGRCQTIRLKKPVEYFGYPGFFTSKQYIASAMTLETCLVASIPAAPLMKILEQNNRLALFFIKMLSEALAISDERTLNLTQKHIRARLAESLLFLKECYGLEEDGYTLSIYMSREDLANMANMTTSNAIRTLSAFATEKLVVVDGRKIKIIKEKELEKISKLG